jgi:hypothetical protein
MTPETQKTTYRVYVLRTWQEGAFSPETPAAWRFSLEDPTTRQRRGFADLESLMSFLAAETDRSQPTDAYNKQE